MPDLIHTFRYGDWFDRFMVLLLPVLVIALIALPFLSYYVIKADREQWAKFAAENNCRVVGKMSGSTSTGFGVTSNGQMGTVVTSTPGKTGYLCDDGVTYWR